MCNNNQVQKVKNYVKVVTLTFRWEDRKQCSRVQFRCCLHDPLQHCEIRVTILTQRDCSNCEVRVVTLRVTYFWSFQ